MRRNPDILRDIMLAAEKLPAGEKLYGSAIKTASTDRFEIADHIQQLIEMGYIDAVVHSPKAVITRVRTPGHDFLQAMRDDTVWRLVKEKVMVPTASWTLAIGVEWAQRYIRQKIGLL